MTDEKAVKRALTRIEKNYHALFRDHQVSSVVKGRKKRSEWFESEPVLSYLREACLIGNAGNRSQIRQFLDAKHFASSDGRLKANGDCRSDKRSDRCSHNAAKSGIYQRQLVLPLK
jgi:hypothetical protein